MKRRRLQSKTAVHVCRCHVSLSVHYEALRDEVRIRDGYKTIKQMSKFQVHKDRLQ